jgi:peptidyl-prolyl cis-trans isomerase SurA
LGKKQVTPIRVPTKRQEAKWQRQKRIRRIIITAAAIFLVSIVSYVGYEYYAEELKGLNEKVITVNNVSFNMRYYVNMLDAQTKLEEVEPDSIYLYSNAVARYIEDAELIRQGAKDLNITVSPEEVEETIKEQQWPEGKVYQDIVEFLLLRERLVEYFDSQLPDEMLQSNTQVMLVESEQVANNVIDQAEKGENFTELVREFSYDNITKEYDGNLGWLPRELMSSTMAETFNLTPGEISQPICDNSTNKSVGYWLIKVSEKDPEKGINVSAMLLGSEQEAVEIKAELDAEGNFSELAKNYSQHSSKYTGGELGWLKEEEKETNDFSDEFNEVAFQLPVDEVSEPVKDETVNTEGGCWVIKVLDKQQRELDDDAREVLKNKRFSEWLEQQRGNSTIENKLDATRMAWAVAEVIKGR